jgi:hypothetical protein
MFLQAALGNGRTLMDRMPKSTQATAAEPGPFPEKQAQNQTTRSKRKRDTRQMGGPG